MFGKRRVILGSAIAALALLSVACGSGAEPESGPPPIDTPIVVTDVAALAYPLDAYRVSAKDRVLVDNAVARLAGDCMRRFGFDWPTFTIPEPARPVTENRYGIADMAKARKWGYHPVPEAATATATAGESYRQPTLTEKSVYMGAGSSSHGGVPVPDGGCLGEGRAAMGVPVPDKELLEERLRLEASDRAEVDPRTVEVFNRWASCMKEAGYDYRSPWAIHNDPQWATPEPTTTEIAAAVADVECRTEHNLVGLWFAVESAYQRLVIEQHAEALTAEKSKWESYAVKAADLLAGTH